MSTERRTSEHDDENNCQQLTQEIDALRTQLQRLSHIEQQHAEQTAFLTQLISLIPLGMAVHTNGIATFVNPACLAIIGAENENDILGKSVINFVHPDSREAAAKRIQALFTSSPQKTTPVAPFIEEKFIRMDGSVIDVEVAALPLIQTDDGMSVMVLFRDITEQKRQQQLLKEREARFRQLISLLPDATVINKNGKIVFANPTAAQLLRLDSVEDIIGHSVFEFLHPDEHESVKQRMQEIAQTGKPLPPIAEMLVRSTGETLLAETTAIPFKENGEDAILVVFHDITERDKMLKALEKSEAKFRTLAELLPASVFMFGPERDLLFINAASQDVLGYSPEESYRMDFSPLLHPDSLKRSQESFRNLALGESTHFELQVKNKQGQWQWLEVTATQTIVDDVAVTLGVAIDVTWRKEVEAILKRQAQKLIKAYEDERARIARELHDEVGQQLIGMKFALESAQRAANSESSAAAIQDARQILATLTENVRELSLSFRPSQLDDLGLLPTLLWHFERYTHHTGIRVHFKHTGFDHNERLSQATEITSYRIVQESLTNIARHAQVSEAFVNIQRLDNHVRIAIQDHGVGFDPQEMLKTHTSSGLSGMKERAELMGGELFIESAPGAGATIIATIPLLGYGGHS